jgi:hypothetical protein
LKRLLKVKILEDIGVRLESSDGKKPKTFSANKKTAKQGETIAGNTRKEIEEKTGKNVVTSLNAKKLAK